jgi:hypothetical protein
MPGAPLAAWPLRGALATQSLSARRIRIPDSVDDSAPAIRTIGSSSLPFLDAMHPTSHQALQDRVNACSARSKGSGPLARCVILLAALTCWAAPALAWEDWGGHDPVEQAMVFTPSGHFSGDLFQFNLSAESRLTFVVNMENGFYEGSNYDITWGITQLFQRDPNAGPSISLGSFEMGAQSNTLVLGPGQYYYWISGYSSGGGFGGNGGRYSIHSAVSAVSAVPEPGSAALFLSGLAALVVMRLRRGRGFSGHRICRVGAVDPLQNRPAS